MGKHRREPQALGGGRSNETIEFCDPALIERILRTPQHIIVQPLRLKVGGHQSASRFVLKKPLHKRGKQWEYLSISRGYAEVMPNKVTVLTETAEMAEEIDIERAERAKRRAEERLREWSTTVADIDFERASAALERALIRLQVARKRVGPGVLRQAEVRARPPE
jgi:ATP synthase, Delta/Epsilon chain, long alpha-helix domain